MLSTSEASCYRKDISAIRLSDSLRALCLTLLPLGVAKLGFLKIYRVITNFRYVLDEFEMPKQRMNVQPN